MLVCSRTKKKPSTGERYGLSISDPFGTEGVGAPLLGRRRGESTWPNTSFLFQGTVFQSDQTCRRYNRKQESPWVIFQTSVQQIQGFKRPEDITNGNTEWPALGARWTTPGPAYKLLIRVERQRERDTVSGCHECDAPLSQSGAGLGPRGIGSKKALRFKVHLPPTPSSKPLNWCYRST